MLLIFSILLPSIILYSLFVIPKTAEAVWFNDNWAYRKRVDTTIASNSSDISNLQMLLTIDTSTSGIASGKMQSSCQDLRFTNTNGKVLPYYIDSGCTTTTTKIWVMVDIVPKNTTTMTLFMYYGNPSAPTGSDVSKFNLLQDLEGYWTLNDTSGNRADSSVNGNTLTDNNTVTSAAGQYSNAGQFTAANSEQLSSASNSSLQTSNGSITIAAWVYLDSTSRRHIVDKGWNGPSGTWEYDLEYLDNSNGFSFYISAGTVSAYGVNNSASASTGTWYFIIAWWDQSSGTANIQVNNGTVNTATVGGTINSSTGAFHIGSNDKTTPDTFWDGRIDDVRYYKRVLTATERTQLYTNPGTIASTAPTTVVPTSPTYNTEEKAPSPVAYWKFDDGQGTNAQDSTTNNADGTLAGTTVPAWKTEDLCISGKCLYFDGLTSKVTVSKVLPSVQTVSMWVKPNTSASTALIDLDGGTHKITTDASSVLSATGFDTPTIYVNGKVSSTLTANSWNYVTITTATSFASTSSLTIGLSGSTYFKGFIDEVKIYPYVRSASQILADYNARGAVKGISADLGGNNETMKQLNNGLVGYWKMDEGSGTLADASGNSIPGTWNGTGTTHYSAGKFGNGGGFNGSDDFVDVPDAAVFDVPVGGSITMAAWVNTAASLTSTIASNYHCTQHFYSLYINAPTRTFRFNNRGTSDVADDIISTSTLSLNTWTHVAVMRDGPNQKLRIYINGVLDKEENTVHTDAISPPQTLQIGRSSVCGPNYWNGSIDEARIYNRALSPQEVSALYNFAPPPKVYLKMDEGTGTSANDSSGNSNNATVNTGTWTTGKYGKGVGVSGSTGSDVSVPDFGY